MSAAKNLDAAAEDLEQAAVTLRRAIADGGVPASTGELVTRIEDAAVRARTQLRPLDRNGPAAADES